MATAAKYPGALLALADVFGEMPNFPQLTLNGSINASVTSIVVNESIPSTWPQVVWITIDSEILHVTSWATKTFTVAARDGSAGNSQSTTAATHADKAYVTPALTAQQWNQLVADLIATQTKIGTGASTPSGTTNVLTATGTGTSAWAAPATGKAGGQTAIATITSPITTGSTSFVDATGVTVTITTTGGDVLIDFSGAVEQTSGNFIYLALLKDGTQVGGTGTAGIMMVTGNGAGAPSNASFKWRDAPTAASHTYKVQWKTNTGTATMDGNPCASLIVTELTH